MISIIKVFREKNNPSIRRNVGEKLDFGKERNSFLVDSGYAKWINKPVQKVKPKTKENKETKQNKKSTK